MAKTRSADTQPFLLLVAPELALAAAKRLASHLPPYVNVMSQEEPDERAEDGLKVLE